LATVGAMPPLHIVDDGRVRIVTFARPEVLNAFNSALYQGVGDALAAAAGDDSIGAVVLTGEGKAFSSGQDLDEMARLAAREQGTTSGFPVLLDNATTFPKPLLAAVNGVAVGIGMTILAHCDLVLVAERARAKVPFTALGVAPEAASSYLFPLRMGWQRAALTLLGGEWMSAEEMVAAGLALRVCPAESLLADTVALAQRLASFPLASVMATKRLMLAGQAAAVADALARENAAFAELLGGFTRS
jgi:enoyl-CoA hydratase/carnithine racemase